MTPLATVSVILLTDNRSDVVRTTIERLLAQDYPAERLEILVAGTSGAETPALEDVIRRDGTVPVRLLRSGAGRPAAQRNQALRAAAGDLVLFLDDDVWVDPDFVATHVAAHAQFAEPVAVLGRVEQSDQLPATPFVRWYQSFLYRDITDLAGRPVPWQHCSSTNLSVPRQALLDAGLTFNENWTEAGHEALELGYRWCRAGHAIIYVPAARAEHHRAYDLADGRRRQASIGRGLRDLEALVAEPSLLAPFGVLSADAPLRQRIGMAARRGLINSATAPPLEWALQRLPRRIRAAEWCSAELMLRHTRLGYTRSAPRQYRQTRNQPEPRDEAAVTRQPGREPVNA